MENKQQQKLVQLFNKFAQEEQSSSFAVQNLLNQVLQILNENNQPPNKEVLND